MKNTELEILKQIRSNIAELQKQLDELEKCLSAEPEEVVAPAAAAQSFDIDIIDISEEFNIIEEAEPEAPAVPEVPVAAPEAPVAAPEAPVVDDMPDFDEPAPVPAPAPAPVPTKQRMPQSWMTDMPGAPVGNIISGISLNDRVLFINTLFKEDPMAFNATISAFNAMGSLEDVLNYIDDKFPDWNMASEVVYRLMMAVRRKLK